MCGLFGGVSSTLAGFERDIVSDLCLINTWRGRDSTGLMDFVPNPASLPKKDKSRFLFWKTLDEPWDFVNTSWVKAEENRWAKSSPKVIAGHTRAATKGSVTRENAHPFDHGPIIGMHNGTIFGEFPNSSKFQTDSEALIHNISTMGIKETLDALGHIAVPAYVLVWMNIKEQTLNFIRNDKRPLHFGRDGANGTTIFWSSDKHALEFVLRAHNKQSWNVESLPEDVLYTVDLSKTFLDIKHQPLKPKRTYTVQHVYRGPYLGYDDYMDSKPTVPFVSPARSGTSSSDAGYTEAHFKSYGTKEKSAFNCRWDVATEKWYSLWAFQGLQRIRKDKKEAKALEKLEKEASKELNDPPFDTQGTELPAEDEKYPVFGKDTTLTEWLSLTAHGCCHCTRDLPNPHEIFWSTPYDPLCLPCAKTANDPNDKEVRPFFQQHTHALGVFLKGLKKRGAN